MQKGRTTGEGAGRPPGDYVFVSYARPDAKAAKTIIQILENAGFIVWWDGLIPGGERFGSRIGEALEGARAVVVLWSASAAASHWVQDEASHGRDRHCLVPLSLDGTQPPLGFRQFQWLDISRGRIHAGNPAVRRALDALVEIMGRPALAPARSAPRVSRRALLGAGGAAAVAAGGFATWKWVIAPDAARVWVSSASSFADVFHSEAGATTPRHHPSPTPLRAPDRAGLVWTPSRAQPRRRSSTCSPTSTGDGANARRQDRCPGTSALAPEPSARTRPR